MKQCSVCGRRPAFYFRRASGHLLCRQCLASALERGIKRSLRGITAFRPHGFLLIAPTAFDPAAAHVVARLLRVPAVRSRARLALLRVKRYPGWDCPEVDGVEELLVEAEPLPQGGVDALDLLRFERALAAEAAKLFGADAALLPVTRSTLSLLGLQALLDARLEFLVDVSGNKMVARGVPVFYALQATEQEAVRALEYSLDPSLPECRSEVKPVAPAKRVYAMVAEPGRPELEYSSVRAAEALVSGLQGYTVCPSCGGPTVRGKGPCDSCLRTEAHRLRLRPLQ